MLQLNYKVVFSVDVLIRHNIRQHFKEGRVEKHKLKITLGQKVYCAGKGKAVRTVLDIMFANNALLRPHIQIFPPEKL